MKKTDRIVQLVRQKIAGKDILEVACGTAEFSLSAARCARRAVCIDIDSKRLDSLVEENEKVSFREMDASEMSFADNTFDTVVLYNALAHIKAQYDRILAECRRVLKPGGSILLIATWKMDIFLMEEMFGNGMECMGEGCIVRLGK